MFLRFGIIFGDPICIIPPRIYMCTEQKKALAYVCGSAGKKNGVRFIGPRLDLRIIGRRESRNAVTINLASFANELPAMISISQRSIAVDSSNRVITQSRETPGSPASTSCAFHHQIPKLSQSNRFITSRYQSPKIHFLLTEILRRNNRKSTILSRQEI